MLGLSRYRFDTLVALPWADKRQVVRSGSMRSLRETAAKRHSMSLTLHPHTDGSSDEFRVMHGGLQVGTIKRTVMMSEKWVWTLSSVLIGAPDVRLSGVTATCEEAGTAVRENWVQLFERPPPRNPAAGPQVLSITVSKIERS